MVAAGAPRPPVEDRTLWKQRGSTTAKRLCRVASPAPVEDSDGTGQRLRGVRRGLSVLIVGNVARDALARCLRLEQAEDYKCKCKCNKK